MECLPRKIPIPLEGGNPGAPFTVPCWALDPNGHLTSAMYFAAADDVLPPDRPYNRVRMEFKRQIREKDTVTPVRFDMENGATVVDLRDSAGNSCAVAEFSTASFS